MERFGATGAQGPGRRPRAIAFTLVELVVSITVGAIVSGAAAMILLNAAKQRGEVAARSELIDTGSTAMETLLRYIREISQDECPGNPTPCLLGNAQVTTADTSDLRFDNYGFRLTGTTLEITNDTGATWHPLLRDVSGLTFTYYGWTTGVEAPAQLSPLPLSAANRNQIRRIQIRIDLARGTETARLQTSIYLRSFMNEVTNAP